MASKQEINKEVLAKEISNAFHKLEINIDTRQIVSLVDCAKKLGVTNTFFPLEFEGKKYLVRCNGSLWPPYKRADEEKILDMLRQYKIETNVLYHGEHVQICKLPNESMKLQTILKNQSPENIERALVLVAREIIKYHSLACGAIKYPLENMLANAVKVLEKKFQDYPEDLTRLKSFSEACSKIVKVLEHANPYPIFNQNDLLPSSIFVDLEQSKVSIVDWEYSALSYWSNDIAILCRSLAPGQKEIFINQYHAAQCAGSASMPEEQKLQVKFNQFIQDFLNLSWKITPQNRLEFQEELDKMQRELQEFMNSLDIRYEKITSMASNALFPMHEENLYNRNRVVCDLTAMNTLH